MVVLFLGLLYYVTVTEQCSMIIYRLACEVRCCIAILHVQCGHCTDVILVIWVVLVLRYFVFAVTVYGFTGICVHVIWRH